MPTVFIDGKPQTISTSELSALFGPAPAAIASSVLLPVSLVRQRLEACSLWDDFSAYLVQYPPLQLKVLSLEGGLLNPQDPDVTGAFTTLAVPAPIRAYVLGPPSLGVGTPPA